MNGYVEFHSLEGDPMVVNVDRVDFVRRFKGGNDASAVNFEKGNYVVVKGNLASVMRTLQDASLFSHEALPLKFCSINMPNHDRA